MLGANSFSEEDRIDTLQWQRIGSALGSNPAGVYQDALGARYYVKTLESPLHAKNEWLAAQLYRLTGAPTLTYLHACDPCQVVTRWRPLQKKSIAHFDTEERALACHWFGVHAWTANWDAVGLHGDNQGVDDNGSVLTLDLGGALLFRAGGDPKGAAFTAQVGEIESLRFATDNPMAKLLFANMSVQQLISAIEVVTHLADELISATLLQCDASAKLVDKLLARKTDMARQLSQLS
ncbi:hypothetical protein HR45_06185 [Shewanella mangrovi]|uniref:Aminoglycoside phosphotransferase domain-containing protein n=1 Tax=Shewanella mangrovi TaxID=1515746 RepID=A0A094LSB9_9GAMM|nr:hypothetical protein [Shewanella mangrovi]KFZ38093.1 hypothetical protein HR45_06185 [Shewanella mangrovi]